MSTITTEQRTSDWIAFLDNDRTKWEAGGTEGEAIANLLISFPHLQAQPPDAVPVCRCGSVREDGRFLLCVKCTNEMCREYFQPPAPQGAESVRRALDLLMQNDGFDDAVDILCAVVGEIRPISKSWKDPSGRTVSIFGAARNTQEPPQ